MLAGCGVHCAVFAIREQRREVKMSANDMQVGGTHYTDKAIQPWDAMEAWMTRDAFCGFLNGNAIKYLARYKNKGGVEDLRKAQHYIAKLIEVECT